MLRLIAALVLTCGVAHGAEITKHTDPTSRKSIIRIGGEFYIDDHRKFIDMALPLDDAIVIFDNSVGGSLDAALRIGRAIRLKEFDTSVAANAACASACGYTWLAGKRRYLEPGARVGFHAAYQLDSSGVATVTGTGNALIGAYLNGLSLSTEALMYITDAGPDEIRWLTIDNVNEVGILAQRTTETKTAAVEPKPKPLQERPDPQPVELLQPPKPRKQFTDPLPKEQPKAAWIVRNGIEIMDDSASNLVTANNANDCQAKCEADLICKGYTFNTRSGECHIKAMVHAVYSNVQAISGYQNFAFIKPKEMQFNVLHSTEFPGWNIQKHSFLSFGSCIQLCERTSKCLAFSYSETQSQCWLKERGAQVLGKKGFTSGFKMSKPAPPLPEFTENENWRRLHATDFYGYDIRDGMATLDAKACEVQCRVHGDCKAYTFNTEKKVCFIKNKIGLAYRNPNAVSGYEGAYTYFHSSFFVLVDGVDLPGGDYGRHKGVTLERCDELCGMVGYYCQGYTYVKFNKTCWLKDHRMGKTPVPNKFTISGIRAAAK